MAKFKHETKASIMKDVDMDDVVKSKLTSCNTVEFITKSGTRVVRYHQTNIVMFHPDGTVRLDNGGWFTRITKQKMNEVLVKPFLGIYQEGGSWKYGSYRYTNGMMIGKNGIPLNPEYGDDGKTKRLKKLIRQYIRGIPAWVAKNKENLGTMSGDCFECMMETQHEWMNSDHLVLHLEEKYYMWSLFYNAVVWSGRNPQMMMHMMWIVPRTVSNYLKFRLGIAY